MDAVFAIPSPRLDARQDWWTVKTACVGRKILLARSSGRDRDDYIVVRI